MIQFFVAKTIRIKTILLFMAVSFFYSGIAQKKDKQIFFRKGDRVCFIGNYC